MPRARRRPKRTLAEMRRRRFLIVLGILALVMLALSPLLLPGPDQPAAAGPSLLVYPS